MSRSSTGKYAVPENVMAVLKPACYDCHSNQTRYPWYAGIQPVAWWLAEHVNDGKRHLNFDEFTTRKIAVQNHKLEEIIEMVKEEEMPLGSYTWTHADARL
ncbi:MAG: heme-binding domain-containing protein, partial [Bacteroidota bacterium]